MDSEILAIVLALIFLVVSVVLLYLFFTGYLKYGNDLTTAAFKSISAKICGLLPIGFSNLCGSLAG